MTTFKNNIVLVYRQQSIIEWCDALDIRVINGRFRHTKKYVYVYIHTNILVDATTITRIAKRLHQRAFPLAILPFDQFSACWHAFKCDSWQRNSKIRNRVPRRFTPRISQC